MDLHFSLPAGFIDEWSVAAPPAVATATEQNDEGDAGGEDEETSTTATIASFLPIILLVVVAYFLLIRPQRRRARQQRDLQSNLDVGDEVMLTSGVYGFITGFESGTDVVWVEIDDDVQIRVSRAAISGKVDTSGAAAAGAAASDDAAADSDKPAIESRRPTLKGGGRPSGSRSAESGASGDTGELADE